MAKSKEETEAAITIAPVVETPVETAIPETETIEESMKKAAGPTRRFTVNDNLFYKGINRLKGSEIELTRPEYNKISQHVTLIQEDIQ